MLNPVRACSRTACQQPAVATLTYVYADSTAVLGPLAVDREPGSLDLCIQHAEKTSAPRGWEVIRLPMQAEERPETAEGPHDDLTALAEAVRAIGLRHDDPEPAAPQLPQEPPAVRTVGHLRLLPGG